MADKSLKLLVIFFVLWVCAGCSSEKDRDIIGEYSDFNGEVSVLIKNDGNIIVSSNIGKYYGKYHRNEAEITLSDKGNVVVDLYVHKDRSLYGKISGVEVRLKKVK